MANFGENGVEIIIGVPKGDKPVKGTDYWTSADKQELVEDAASEVQDIVESSEYVSTVAANVNTMQVVYVSGSTPAITGVANTRYVCGEVSTISITPPETGIIDVIFRSGNTAAQLTLPNDVVVAGNMDVNSLNTNSTYEVNIMDGLALIVDFKQAVE